MIKFFQHLRGVLSQDERFIDREGNLIRNKVSEAATLYDQNLLTLLLGDDLTAKTFFVDAAGVKVFKQNDFIQIVNGSEFLPDSFTRYANVIGLVDDRDQIIARTSDIALVFPYKDCLLQGGQTKDDQKRSEIFFNTTLAKDDVDRLLKPKVLVNATRFDANGSAPAVTFDDKTDNLIVKGNNLIALASLAERFSGQVKCIYIDPPYNTGNDGFNYNDRFNHSTWLTFMTNRLELAKKLLADDGSIWISIDDDEQAYLKVLADDIFKRDNFVATVIWEKKYSPQNDATWLSDSHDFILVYAKNKSKWRPNLLPRTEEMDARYRNPDNDPRGAWTSGDVSVKTYSEAYDYPITLPSGRIVNPPTGRCWRCSKEKFAEMVADNRIWFGEDGNNVPRIKRFLSEVQQGAVCKTIWAAEEVGDNQSARREVLALGVDFGTPKPERLLERILTLATRAGDLVLDFFLGSGTTAAVAHKMGRRYIGVEQMDYVQTLTVERLKKVIGGEAGGISARVGWQGGGSFVYCELSELNQRFVAAIERATEAATLEDLRGRILNSGYISCKADPAQIDAARFGALTIDEQKRLLMMLLDMNMLYVSRCDLEDEDFAIAEGDKEFTRSFYEAEA